MPDPTPQPNGQEPTPQPNGQEPTPQPNGQEPTPQPNGQGPATTTLTDPTPQPNGQEPTLFLDSLGELKDNDRLKSFKDVGEMAKAFAEANIVDVPEVYELPEGMPEEFGAWAKKGNFSQAQVNEMLNMNSNLEEGRMQKNDADNSAGFQELMKAWGDEAQQKENIALAKKTLQYFDVDGKLADMLGDRSRGSAGNNAVVIDFLYQIGKQTLAEDSFVLGGKHSQSGGKSTADKIFNWVPPTTS